MRDYFGVSSILWSENAEITRISDISHQVRGFAARIAPKDYRINKLIGSADPSANATSADVRSSPEWAT
jgi:hypothetical protein